MMKNKEQFEVVVPRRAGGRVRAGRRAGCRDQGSSRVLTEDNNMKTPYTTAESDRVLHVAWELYRAGKIRFKTYQVVASWAWGVR